MHFHSWRKFSFLELNLSVSSDSLFTLSLVSCHHSIIYLNHHIWRWLLRLEPWFKTLFIDRLLACKFLEMLLLVSLIKAEWSFVLFCDHSTLCLYFSSSLFISLHDLIIPWSKYFWWWSLCSELFLDCSVFLEFLFSNHSINFSFTNRFWSSLLSSVKFERFRNSDWSLFRLLSMLLGLSMPHVVFCRYMFGVKIFQLRIILSIIQSITLSERPSSSWISSPLSLARLVIFIIFLFFFLLLIFEIIRNVISIKLNSSILIDLQTSLSLFFSSSLVF